MVVSGLGSNGIYVPISGGDKFCKIISRAFEKHWEKKKFGKLFVLFEDVYTVSYENIVAHYHARMNIELNPAIAETLLHQDISMHDALFSTRKPSEHQ